MREAAAMCRERRARTVMWGGPMSTLGAWTYASPGESLQLLKQRWSSRLRDVLTKDGLFYGGRAARVACRPPHGLDFVSQRDAFLIRPLPRRVLLPGLPSNSAFAPSGSLVVAARGTLGDGEIFGRPILVAGALRNTD